MTRSISPTASPIDGRSASVSSTQRRARSTYCSSPPSDDDAPSAGSSSSCSPVQVLPPVDRRLHLPYDVPPALQRLLRRDHLQQQHPEAIKLHIIAMHELCECNKGEGFSEGFDAHLNIEQMNKTSVELFQMYDDHRRKGVFFSTEKEFWGYYALLKLDKHPGYKVEPAELSLDLAKMSCEIRGSPEILFAREVARACRMGNFISFFRLARKATYLQAYLMHAHFAKLRRQALASLHSGLPNSQGIPISHVVEWLAMEEILSEVSFLRMILPLAKEYFCPMKEYGPKVPGGLYV